jgi:hypothetical protein
VSITTLRTGSSKAWTPPITFHTGSFPTAVQVSAVPGVSRQVAFTMSQKSNRVIVEEHDLLRDGRLARRFVSAALSRAPGVQRDLRIAIWSGRHPDLFVIDRRQPTKTMRVRVLSGESGFSSRLLDVTVAHGAGFPRSQFSVDVGRVSSGRPDIIFVTHYPKTGSGATEVHILSGDTHYADFLLQAPSVLSSKTESRLMVFGYRHDIPTWFSVIVSTGRVQPFALVFHNSR